MGRALSPAPQGATGATSAPATDRWRSNTRLGGLRRFAFAISVLTVLGHTWLGFEQAWSHPLAAVGTAYAMELLLELVDARARGRAPAWSSRVSLIDFLLPAHISGLAVAMLLYSGSALGPVVFASAAAIGSKAVLRARVGRGTRHVFNPSNFGITLCLLAFPWVGIAPPYMFTEELGSLGDWALPALIVVSGSTLNGLYTKRLPLITAWLLGFLAQGFLRHLIFGAPLAATWMPMTGVAFLLFTFYMVTDPATTPVRPWAQVAFGLAVAACYGTLMTLHVVFGLFFGLSIVCAGRALYLWFLELAGFADHRASKSASAPLR